MKDNEKQRSDSFYSSEGEKGETIDFRKFSPEKEKAHKPGVLKLLFKKNKVFDLSSDSDERPTVDLEAKKISERFGIAHSILWVVLIAFVVGYVTFFSDSITTGSMQHVFRNMLGHGKIEEALPSYGYSVNDNSVYAEFSGVPVIAGSDRVIIFAPDGSHQYSDESPYTLPSIEASDEYILIYDTLGSTFGIYDAFGIRYTENEGGRIVDGAVSDNGTFAVARKGNDYNSEISVYASNFELLNRIKKNNRVASIDVRADGSEMMVISYYVYPDGSVESELMLLEVRSDAPRRLITINEGMPLECRYTSDGRIVILFDDMISLLDRDGNEITSMSIDVDGMFSYTLGENGELLYLEGSYNDAKDFTAHLLRIEDVGVKKYQYDFRGRPTGLNMYGGKAYIITGQTVIRLDTDGLQNAAYVDGSRHIYGITVVNGKEYVAYVDTLVACSFTEK